MAQYLWRIQSVLFDNLLNLSLNLLFRFFVIFFGLSSCLFHFLVWDLKLDKFL